MLVKMQIILLIINKLNYLNIEYTQVDIFSKYHGILNKKKKWPIETGLDFFL